MKLGQKHSEPEPMQITAGFEATTRCWICHESFCGYDEELKKVRDHCHFTGDYRGAAYNKCNLRLKQEKTIPVL